MELKTMTTRPYQLSMKNGQMRSGFLIEIIDGAQRRAWGDVAPLPKWSEETLEECIQQFEQNKDRFLEINWESKSALEKLRNLNLLPALTFGLESAILSLLLPLESFYAPVSALLMGTVEEILAQAEFRKNEGYTSAKLKISNLDFISAKLVIDQLKHKFKLRIDVNRAWKTEDSLQFFSQFPLDTFDYVEEPFQNPKDLVYFTHPLAVDESYPKDLTLSALEKLPTLKAMIYKPTIQGGMTGCMHLHEWTEFRKILLILSSSFESDLGLMHIASMANRLKLSQPIGIGTYDFLKEYLCVETLRFERGQVQIAKNPQCR